MTGAAAALRLDKLLWYLRLCRSRGAAQALAETGHVRLDGRRVDRGHALVRCGNVLTLPLAGEVQIVRITALPARRGPPPEARGCYQRLDGQDAPDAASGSESDSQQAALP